MRSMISRLSKMTVSQISIAGCWSWRFKYGVRSNQEDLQGSAWLTGNGTGQRNMESSTAFLEVIDWAHAYTIVAMIFNLDERHACC